MINTRKEANNFPLKKEANNIISSDHGKTKLASSSTSSSSSSQWLKLKDPRIIRVSRAFGGKDRHSKVCTIRGLRDRRVRLSVPTAIHLYDLQDRLGLNQPSKVVDWLLQVAKDEIDELPPLPIPPENFILGYNNFSSLDHQFKGKKVIYDHHEDKQVVGANNVNLQNNNLLARPNHPSFLGLLNTMPSFGYNNNQLELPSSSSHHEVVANSSSTTTNLRNYHIGLENQSDTHSFNFVPLSSGGTSQIFVCNNPNNGASTQPYFTSMEMDARQMDNHHDHYHQVLSSSSSNSQNLLTNLLCTNPNLRVE